MKNNLLWLTAFSIGISAAAGAAPAAAPWEPDYAQLAQLTRQQPGAAEAAFVQAAIDFLRREGIDPKSVDVELRNLGPAGSWRALANVSVNSDGRGRVHERLAFEPEFWMDSAHANRFANHRWAKVLWHEMHHLRVFPVNLRRAPGLAEKFAPARPMDFSQWKNRWIELLEPMEEMAAEDYSIQRYRAAFGPLSPELARDSQGDMRRHAARYRQLLSAILAEAKDPAAIRHEFPEALPIDPNGTILASAPLDKNS